MWKIVDDKMYYVNIYKFAWLADLTRIAVGKEIDNIV
jgi:hypothetical protein